jgi:protein TonB
MFESTLEAQGLNDGERRLGSLSAAALAHLGIGTLILAVTAIIVPPVKTPEPMSLVGPTVHKVELGDLSPTPTPRRPKKGTDAPSPGPTVAPPAIETHPPPVDTPPLLPDPLLDAAAAGPDGPGEGTPGDRLGSELGVPDGGGDADSGPGSAGGAAVGPVYVNGDMVRPLLLVKVEPSYPLAARRAGLSGRVTVSAVIGLEGGVESAEVLASSNPLFDQAALDAVRKWRYRPATMNGRPVRVFFTVVVDFVVR